MVVDKAKLKKKICDTIGKLMDGCEKTGDLNFFEINIKHTQGDLSVNLINKYKAKL